MTPSRRTFLGLALVLLPARRLRAGQGLDQFAIAGPPCTDDAKTTPAVAADATYRAGAPRRPSLAEGTAGDRLAITGTVSGVTCGRIKDALVEVWHADRRGVYDMSGSRFRGAQMTDAEGRYRFSTVMPGQPQGRARHVGVHVRVAGKADFWTEMFFPNDAAASRDSRFRPELVARVTSARDGTRTATFDIVLEI